MQISMSETQGLAEHCVGLGLLREGGASSIGCPYYGVQCPSPDLASVVEILPSPSPHSDRVDLIPSLTARATHLPWCRQMDRTGWPLDNLLTLRAQTPTA